jgi:hypothetical protein
LLNRDVHDQTSVEIVEVFTSELSLACGFLLLTYIYHSKPQKIFIWSIVILSILFAIIRARRSLMFILICPVLITYLIYITKNKLKLPVVILSIFLCGLLMIYGIKFFNESSLFSSVKKRGLEDTRSNVEDCYYSDMKTIDWIIGKGMNGRYYCPDIDANGTTDYRYVIETGYLNIILKGGLIDVVLLLLIMIPAIFMGLFYSNNLLSKAAAIWILLWLIDLFPTMIATFTLNYLLVWISVAICYNKRIRNVPEKIMKPFLLKFKL